MNREELRRDSATKRPSIEAIMASTVKPDFHGLTIARALGTGGAGSDEAVLACIAALPATSAAHTAVVHTVALRIAAAGPARNTDFRHLDFEADATAASHGHAGQAADENPANRRSGNPRSRHGATSPMQNRTRPCRHPDNIDYHENRKPPLRGM